MALTALAVQIDGPDPAGRSSAVAGPALDAGGAERALAALSMQAGLWYLALGRRVDARDRLVIATQRAPGWADAWHNLAQLDLLHGEAAAAARALRRADELAPRRPATLRLLGLALARQGQPAAALQCLDHALEVLADAHGAPPPQAVAALADRAAVLSTLGRLDEALHSAQQARQLDPDSASAWNNEAAVLLRQHRPAPALEAAQHALRCTPSEVAAAGNRIRALHLMGRMDEAMEEAQALTQSRPGAASAWNLRLGLCTLAGRWAEAAQAGERLLQFAPDTPFAAGRRLYALGKLCRWNDWAAQVAQHAQAIATGQPAAVPFGLLALLDDGGLQRQATQAWLQQEVPVQPPTVASFTGAAAPMARRHSRRPGPWRVGWLSADFRAHATARLLVGTFEALDPLNFEHHALSITPVDPADPMQQRLRAALPRWHELQALDDERAARAIAALHLDVLVDLGGLTHGARPGVLARRPAPWQLAYLGFMGSSSALAPLPLVDATVADDTTVPVAHAADFGEQVLRLPTGLWPREVAQRADRSAAAPVAPDRRNLSAPSVAWPQSPASLSSDQADTARDRLRRAHGLPLRGFVFCNFCDATKLNPSLFDVWMRLLQAVPGSVLWLRQGTDEMVGNLQAEAAQRGVSPGRLVWARRLPWVQHLKRHAAADLFLDSWPCNGHTTVADALLSGLPVVTLQGRSMAARVAASQLQTLGLQDLVCLDHLAYETLAVDLALQPQRLAQLVQRLQAALQVEAGPHAVRRYADALLDLLISDPGGQPAATEM